MTPTDSFPTVTYSEVAHVGHLDEDRAKPRFSHEGGELSVSQHPDAWRQIASGVGGKTHRLTHPDDPVFYDANPGGPPRDFVIEACVDAGYIELVDGVKATWETEKHGAVAPGEDPETETVSVLKVARDEAEGAIPHEAMNPRLESAEVPMLAKRGEAYWEESFSSSPGAASVMQVRLLTPVWFARIHDLMGMWQHTEYAPYDYSAPCGAILHDRVDEWRVTVTRR